MGKVLSELAAGDQILLPEEGVLTPVTVVRVDAGAGVIDTIWFRDQHGVLDQQTIIRGGVDQEYEVIS